MCLSVVLEYQNLKVPGFLHNLSFLCNLAVLETVFDVGLPRCLLNLLVFQDKNFSSKLKMLSYLFCIRPHGAPLSSILMALVNMSQI